MLGGFGGSDGACARADPARAKATAQTSHRAPKSAPLPVRWDVLRAWLASDPMTVIAILLCCRRSVRFEEACCPVSRGGIRADLALPRARSLGPARAAAARCGFEGHPRSTARLLATRPAPRARGRLDADDASTLG